MDVEKGENKKSSKKKKMPATNGMDARNQRQQKNLPNNESHPTQPKVQFPTHTTEKKPTHNTPEMPQQNQMDSKQCKSKKSSKKEKPAETESKMGIKKNGQSDNIPVMPQQQNQKYVEKGQSIKSTKKNKPKENGSKMVVMNEEKDPFDNDVRPIFPEGKFSTPVQQQKDNDLQQDQTDPKTPIFNIAETDKKKGSHHEKPHAPLTAQQQCPKKQEQQVPLTPEQQQLNEERQKLDKEWLRLGQHQQQVEQQRMEQQQRESLQQQQTSNQPEVNVTKPIKNLETAHEYQFCGTHVKSATPIFALFHFNIIIALLFAELILSSAKNLKGIEIAGFVFLGLSLIFLAVLSFGICLEDDFFLFLYAGYGYLESLGIFIFMILLCIEYGGLKYEQLGMTPTWAIILTVFISIISISLRFMSSFAALDCSDYYRNQKKTLIV